MHNSTSALPRAHTADAEQPLGSEPRRRRRAAATIATTLGAAAILTTTFGTPAQAAGRYRVWDRVANCESSNRWQVNTGNGYYGGLQFSPSTWAAYHGHRYARQASGATRREQIEVARRVLAAQGPNAWPVCGPRAGLTRTSGHATHARLPRHPGRRTHRHVHAHIRHHVRRHAHTRHLRAAARRHPLHTYRVRSGDTLSAIAHRHHIVGGWRALYRANRHRLSSPNVLHVGQVLRLP
jgi:nucleoid-associated protein YgaU